jgi:hypothetical protein
MCAVEADDSGEFTMMPLIAPGRTLKINAVTLRTGSVKVEVVGANGRTLDECNSIIGDQHWANVTWKKQTDLGVQPGRPITLRIALKQAKLYGLEFE